MPESRPEDRGLYDVAAASLTAVVVAEEGKRGTFELTEWKNTFGLTFDRKMARCLWDQLEIADELVPELAALRGRLRKVFRG